MKVSFLSLAELELDDAFKYYDTINSELSSKFINEVKRAISRVSKNPFSYQKIGAFSRRSLLHKFPYGLIYQPKENEILIIAISHLHRRPDYWCSREKQKIDLIK